MHETNEPPPYEIDLSRYHAFVEDAEDVESYTLAPLRARSRDSGFVSSHVSPAAMPELAATAAVSPQNEDTTEKVLKEPMRQTPTEIDNEPLSEPTKTPDIGASRSSTEKPDVFQRAALYINISSDEFTDANEMVDSEQRPSANTPGSRPATSGGSHIIDLCSGEEDVATPAGSRHGIEATPDIGVMEYPNRPSTGAVDSEELRWPSSKKRKHMPGNYISSDENEGEDDEVLEEVDGGAWKRASLRQSQG